MLDVALMLCITAIFTMQHFQKFHLEAAILLPCLHKPCGLSTLSLMHTHLLRYLNTSDVYF